MLGSANTISFRASDGNTVRVEYRESLPSTAALAKEYAKSGYPDRYVVFAEKQTAVSAVERAKNALLGGFSADVCGLDLEEALARLGEIDGRGVTEAVTNDIFHRFCVGK